MSVQGVAFLFSAAAVLGLVRLRHSGKLVVAECPAAQKGNDSDRANPMLKGFSLPLRLTYKLDGSSDAVRNAGCVAVASKLVSGWSNVKQSDVSITCLQGGLTNQLYLLKLKEAGAATINACLVRLYGFNTELIIERSEEELVFHIMAEKQFAPKVYGFFDNGRVEEFIPCVGVEPSDLGANSFPHLIASELARLHYLDMPLCREPYLWDFIHKFESMSRGLAFPQNLRDQARLEALQLDKVRGAMERLEKRLPSKCNKFGAELQASKSQSEAELLARKFLFEPVFCHNDLLAGNILLLPDANRVQFIDFEYGKYNFRGFDFGNHFCEYAGFDFDLKKWYPKPTEQKDFVRAYIAAGARQGAQDLCTLEEKLAANPVLEKAFYAALIPWIDAFATSSNLLWGFWALVQKLYSPIDFDYLDYARLRLEAVSLD